MRKKIYGILTAVFLLFACVFASACGNKYKDMKFKVYYAFSAQAEKSEWYDASQGVLLNYGAEQDELIFDENGNAKIYFKVKVSNVKAKHIDQILISANMVGGLDSISHESVSQNQVFSLTLSGSIQTDLRIYETNSGKEASVSVGVYESLKSISVRQDVVPAVVVGQALDLDMVNNIIYNPTETNQKGVTYQIESVGKYDVAGDADSYMPASGVAVATYLDLEPNTNALVLKNDDLLKLLDCSVVRIKAISKYSTEENIIEPVSFDVYLVENVDNTQKPEIVFASSNEAVEAITLYNTDNYSSSKVKVSNVLESLYAEQVNTSKGVAKYELVVYIDGKKYNLTEQEAYNGLRIEPVENKEGVFKFVYAKSQHLHNDVTFAYELQGLDFYGVSVPAISQTIRVTKKVLPTEIRINDVALENGDSASFSIYSTTYSVSGGDYRGLPIKVDVNPSNSVNNWADKETIEFNASVTNLIIRNEEGQILSGHQTIKTGDVIYVAFDDRNETEASIIFRTKALPDSFEGKEIDNNADGSKISVECRFTKIVTANDFEVFADLAGTQKNVYIDAKNGSDIYVRAYFTAQEDSALNASTLKLTANEDVLTFGSYGSSLVLDSVLGNLPIPQRYGYDVVRGERYAMFKVPVKITGNLVNNLNYRFTLSAGDNTVGLIETATVVPVNVATSTDFRVETVNKNQNQNVSDLGNSNFAIAYKAYADFVINNGTKQDFSISGLTINKTGVIKAGTETVITDFSSSVISASYSETSRMFSVAGDMFDYTALVELDFNFYAYNEEKGCIELNRISAVDGLDVSMQVAVYQPIGRINASYKNSIAYVNSKIQGINEVNIGITATAITSAVEGTPSSLVTFKKGSSFENKSNINMITLTFPQIIRNLINTEVIDVFVKEGTDLTEVNINQEIKLNTNSEIVVKLKAVKENFNLDAINLLLTALRFGEATNVKNNVVLNVADIQKASSVTVSGDNIVLNKNRHEIQLSHMQAVEGFASKEFEAYAVFNKTNSNVLKFDDLGFILYEYEVDENGNIKTTQDANGNTVEVCSQISPSNDIMVQIADNKVRVMSREEGVGGIYKLEIGTLDSYFVTYDKDGKPVDNFANKFDLTVRVSDGSKQYKYLINTAEDFEKINLDLDACYALTSDIRLDADSLPLGYKLEPTGRFVIPFNGELTTDGGEGVSKHTITYTLTEDNVVLSTEGYVLYGLFAELGQNASIANIALDVTYDFKNAVEYKNVNIGAIAGINNSNNVKNVDINISSLTDVEFENSTNNVLNVAFGGAFGINKGTINNVSIAYNPTGLSVITNVKSLNFGLLVGENSGTIKGSYKGNDSLNNVVYDVLGYATITNKNSFDPLNVYYIGGVVGKSTGTVSNILVGGSLELAETAGALVNKANGFIGGIAGNTESAISTSATLALDLKSQSNSVKVGGAVGFLNGSTLSDVKVISVKLTNDRKTTTGLLTANVKGGLVATVNSGTIEYCGVQNFINTSNTERSFVKEIANGVTIKNSYIIDNNYVKFIGDGNSYEYDNAILSGVNFADYIKLDLTVTAENFANKLLSGLYIKNGENYIKQTENDSFASGTEYFVFDVDLWEAKIKELVGVTDWVVAQNGWAAKDGNNVVVVKGVEFYLPYIVKYEYNSSLEHNVINPIIVIQPDDIAVSLDQDYIIDTDSVYVDDYEEPTYSITETVLINFKYLKGKDNTALNTHKLEDLLSLEIFPEDAKGALKYEIIGAGYQFAYIKYDNGVAKIVFSGASGSIPITVKVYSLFNEEVFEYVQFYTVLGVSDLTLTSNSITKLDNAKYTVNVYTGTSQTLISVGTENVVDGINYESMFDVYKISEYIRVDHTVLVDAGKTSKLEIQNSSNSTDFTLKVKETADVEDNEQETIVFTLKLNLTKYLGLNTGSDVWVDIASAEVLARIYFAAEEISLSADAYDLATSESVTILANLYTGKVDDTETRLSVVVDAENGNRIEIDAGNRDALAVEFECVEGEEELEAIKTKTGVSNTNELFDYDVTIKPLTQNGETVGYTYSLIIKLVDDRDYRYIQNNIKFNLKISATSDPRVSKNVDLTFKPTNVSTIRIENYAVTNISVNQDSRLDLIESSIKESSVIAPGGKGNMMFIYIEPTYSNVKTAKLTSTELYVPSLGRNVNLKFTQFAYNNQKQKFETLQFGEVQNGNTLNLQMVTGYNNGVPYYEGILYVHVQLAYFEGLGDTISAMLDVTTEEGAKPTVTKPLLTTYLPGASIEFNGDKINGRNVVEQGTFNNVATIKVFGYQFNANPDINFGWNLAGVSVNSTLRYTNAVEHTGVDADSFIDVIGKNNFIWYKQARFENVAIGSAEEFATAVTNFGKLYTNNNGLYSEASVYAAGVSYYKLVGYFWATTTEFIDNVSTYYVVESHSSITNGTNTYLIGDYINYYLETDYTKVQYNEEDRSYSMKMYFSVKEGIPAAFHIGASLRLVTQDGFLTASEYKYTVITPADYVIKGVEVNGLSNGNKVMIVGNTEKLELRFTTANENKDSSTEIYNLLLSKYSAENLKTLFYYVYGEKVGFDKSIEEFDVNIIGNKVAITSISQFDNQINFNVKYGYVFNETTGKYELSFLPADLDLSTSFRLAIYPLTSEDKALPIESAQDFLAMKEGENYILMNDITLENYTPISTAIASLDGNNRVIKISSFAQDTALANYGLFAQIGTYVAVQDEESETTITRQTILKNVMVDYGYCQTIVLTDNTASAITFGGLVAVNNGGLIYNCDVINTSSAKRSVHLYLDNDDQLTLTFGGLVGINKNSNNNEFDGIITNSRVGRSSYTRITANSTFETTTEVNLRPLEFTLSNSLETGASHKFNVVAGGFVGVNNGTIASSYVANTSLINYSTSEKTNKTAGFVAENTGDIAYSYVKALESTITRENPRATGAQIENKGNGIVAGFVYDNKGDIENSFANTELITKSAYISGFVYNNYSNGVIKASYAACTMNPGSTADVSEQPFVGINKAGESLSNGTLENTYYLLQGDISDVVDETKDQATALDLSNFQESNNLIGFVFINSNAQSERQQGLWSYFTHDNKQHILPELTNANQIAHSYRYVVEKENGQKEYTNAVSYALGTKNNPHIIRNVQEYNEVFSTGNAISKTGYVRLISNINFENDETAIKTRVNYTLGDAKIKSNLTSFDGNGMTISGIYLDVEQANNTEIGLFAKIENAYVKNLNLKFATPKSGNQFSTTDVMYSGGLAGKINNSTIINVNLDGKNTTLTGKNFVGGLAGMVTGQSMIYSVRTNLSVKAGYTSSSESLYYSEKDYYELSKGNESYQSYLTRLSYAGGVAGVIDLEERVGTSFNMSFVEVHGDEMYTKTFNGNAEANILADFAGGVAGFASKTTSSLKLKYFTGHNDVIRGDIAAGGIYGVALGSVTASQVTADEDVQYNYDTTLGQYIIKQRTDSNATLNKSAIGNTKLIESYKYAGGLIGVGLGASVNASYAKASINSGVEVGGLIGVSVASGITYSYAVPFVNYNTSMKNVGGLIGSAYSVLETYQPRNQEIADFETIVEYNGIKNSSTDVQFTFSTIMFDNAELEANKEFISNEDNNVSIDYICANYTNTSFTSNGSSVLTYVYAGKVSTYNATLVKNANPQSHSDIELYKLFDHSTSEYVTTFSEVFAGWSVIKYWTLDNLKYYPLLLNNGVENFILIKDAADFLKMTANPKGNYKIVKDIDMSSWTQQSNWIFNCDFQGTLVGDAGANDDGTSKKPKVYNLHLTTQAVGANTTGLFQQTTNASISNVIFIWGNGSDPAIKTPVSGNGSQITNVGGLSCLDNGSTFTNTDVRVAKGSTLIQTTEGQNSKIKGFGGIVAQATDTNILGASFTGNVSAELYAKDNVFFGGIVGNGEKTTQTIVGTQDKITSMTVVNSNVGLDDNDSIPKTSFTVVISKDATATREVAGAEPTEPEKAYSAYIGSIAGRLYNASVSGNRVGGTSYTEDYQSVTTDLTIDNSDIINYFGGMIGYSVETSITKSDIVSSLNVKTTQAHTKENNFGGIVGLYSIAAASDEKIISLTNSNANINMTEATHKLANVNVSAGIASINGRTTVKQCLFTGSLDSDGANAISEVRAGGAIAYASGDEVVTIQESMSTVDMLLGSTGTESMYVGGLVGDARTTTNVIFSASTGKIVPITSSEISIIEADGENKEQDVAIGGIIGKTTSSTIKNSYTLSSIIGDELNGNAIAKASVNAVIGKGNVAETDKVYYSSDYALCGETNANFHNLGANALVYSKEWRKDSSFSNLSTDDGTLEIWVDLPNYKEILGLNHRLPYIISLETAMCNYSILYEGDYIEGSPMRPKVISTQEHVDNKMNADQFSYYLYKAEETLTITKTLNGVLIGNENEIQFNGLGFVAETPAAIGFVPKVAEHSAVSNIHIRVADNGTITTTNVAANSGIIVGNNKGVVFNSSLQGKGIQSTIDAFGGIVGLNDGLVSHCYSTAEYVKGNNIGGIVHTNTGRISSSFFTGYIEHSGSGITVTTNETDSYLYNNYTAGVIKTYAADESIVSSLTTSITVYGEKNYVDKYASSDVVKTYKNDETVTINVVNTSNLMSLNADGKHSLLDGLWHASTDKDGFVNPKFGKNYGYPIHIFNKNLAISGNNDVDYMYQENTGTGAQSGTAAELLSGKDANGKTNVYDNALKIPHLGVLQAVQGVLAYQEKAAAEPTPLNYVLIYDIDGKLPDGKNKEWTAIGQDTESGFNKPESGFTGVFVSNRYLSYTEGSAGNKNTVKVENISKNGLFADIHNAYIANITLGNFADMKSSGALGTTVTGETTVNLIDFGYYEDGSNKIPAKITGASVVGGGTNFYGALFGSVDIGEGKKLTVNALNTYPKEGVTYYPVTLEGNNDTYAGLIAGKSSSDIKVGGTLGVKLVNNSVAGALIGRASGGQITVCDHIEITLNGGGVVGGLVGESEDGVKLLGELINTGDLKSYSSERVTVIFLTMHISEGAGAVEEIKNVGIIGGLVGSGGGTYENFNIDTRDNDKYHNAQFTANAFGGLIGNASKGAKFELVGLLMEELNIITRISTDAMMADAYKRYVGLIAAVNTATSGLTVSNYTVKTAKLDVNEEDGALDLICNHALNYETGIGAFVGHQTDKGNLEVTNLQGTIKEADKLTITSNGITNLGGIVGYYAGGKIETTGYTGSVILNGTKNVGGLFGVCNAKTLAELSTEIATKAIAKIVLDKELGTKFENIGGMFGLLKTKLVKVTEKDEVTPEGNITKTIIEKLDLTNNNTIVIGKGKTATNVGGIAGLFEVSALQDNEIVAKGLTNNAAISTKEPGIFNETDGIISSRTTTSECCKAINVGGVFGKVTNDSEFAFIIEDLANKADVTGYQNVGGLVGLIPNVPEKPVKAIITDTEGITLATDAEGNAIDLAYKVPAAGGELQLIGTISESDSVHGEGKIIGVINVGGVVGYAGEGSTIEKIYATAKVYGNTNVGSLVGLTDKAVVQNNYVGKAKSNTEVKAVYYSFMYETPKGTDSTIETVAYLPTSVGGLIGKTNNTTVLHNVMNKVSVTSAKEGANSSSAYGVISTNKNHIISNATSAEVELNKDDLKTTEFDEMSTGFGGFIGTIDTDTMSSMRATLNVKTIETLNYMIDPKIEAQLGINVGTYYGYVNLSTLVQVAGSGENIPIVVPRLYGSSEVEVDGAYNVGGIIGSMGGLTNVSNIKNSHLAGNATIKLQSKHTGIYVGGLIGKLSSSTVDNLNIRSDCNVNIIIDTSKSYHMGGLVGNMIMSGGGTFVGSVGKIATDENGNITAHENDQITEKSYGVDYLKNTSNEVAMEFGGLIGMLNIGQASGSGAGVDVSVSGTHYYPFTVNTIRNRNYTDGKSVLDSAKTNDYINLIALASYTNNDTISISASSNTELYNYDTDGNGIIQDFNPARPSAYGWIRAYTGFKTIQRCIPQDGIGDSLAVIYDAANITQVGTIRNLGLMDVTELQYDGDEESDADQYLTGEGIIKQYTGKETLSDYDDYICYTIYEEDNYTPRLYSRIGIAGLLITEDENEKIDGKNAIKYLTPEDEKAEWYEWIGGVFTGDQPDQEWYISIDSKTDGTSKNASLRALTGFNFEAEYKTLSNEDRAYTNEEDNGEDSLLSSVYQTNGDKLPYVYSHLTTKNDKDNVSPYWSLITLYTKGYRPASGSMLDQYAMVSDETHKDVVPAAGKTTFEKVVFWGTIIVDIIILVVSMGCGSMYLAAAKGGAIFVAKAGAIAGKAALKYVVVFFATAIASAIHMVYLATQQASNALESSITYYRQINSQFGYVTSAYSRDISYDGEGKLRYFTERIVIVNDETYIFASYQRPADYYSSYYTGLQYKVPDPNNPGQMKNGDGSTKTFNESATKTVFTQEENGTNVEYEIFTDKDGNQYLNMGETYIYYEAAYYRMSKSSTLENYPAQFFTPDYYEDEDGEQKEKPAGYRYDYNGCTYVYGSFNNGEYSIGPETSSGSGIYESAYPTNLLTYNGGVYKVNGVEVTADIEMTATQGNVEFVKTTTTLASLNSIGAVKGYHYFDTVYYTANGAYSKVCGTKKYAQFTKESASNPMPAGAKEGIDYIKVLTGGTLKTENGTTVVENPVYTNYILTDSATSGKPASDYNGTTIITDTTINVELFAHSFTNPQCASLKAKATTVTETGVFYTRASADSEEDKISQSITYYYYEGGYVNVTSAISGVEDLKSKIDAGIELTEDEIKDANVVDIANSINGIYKCVDKSEYDNIHFDLDKSGSYEESETYTLIIASGKTGLLTDNRGDAIYIANGYVYKKIQRYTIAKGTLHQQVLILLNHTMADFNQNMYATNPTVGLYTRFKYIPIKDSAYVNGDPVNDDLTGLWYDQIVPENKAQMNSEDVDNYVGVGFNSTNYRLIPENGGSYLPQGITRFTERCQVTLCGGRVNGTKAGISVQ